MAIVASLLILCVFNPIDAALEEGRTLADYRAKAISAVMATEHPNCICQPGDGNTKTNHACLLCTYKKETKEVNEAITSQFEFPAPISWFAGLCKWTHSAFITFATSPFHPVYVPLRVLAYTVLLLSLAGLFLAFLHYIGFKALSPCEALNGLKLPDLAGGEGGAEAKQDKKAGSGASLRLLAATLLTAPPVVASLYHVTSETRLQMQVDTGGLSTAMTQLAVSLEKSAKSIADPNDKSGDGNNLASALKKQVIEVRSKDFYVLLNGGTPLGLNLSGKAILEGGGVNMSGLDAALYSISHSIGAQHDALYKLVGQADDFNKNMQNAYTLIGETAFGLKKTENGTVKTDMPGLTEAENMQMLCGRLELYSDPLWTPRKREIVAEYLGLPFTNSQATEAENDVLDKNAEGVKELCCKVYHRFKFCQGSSSEKRPAGVAAALPDGIGTKELRRE